MNALYVIMSERISICFAHICPVHSSAVNINEAAVIGRSDEIISDVIPFSSTFFTKAYSLKRVYHTSWYFISSCLSIYVLLVRSVINFHRQFSKSVISTPPLLLVCRRLISGAEIDGLIALSYLLNDVERKKALAKELLFARTTADQILG